MSRERQNRRASIGLLVCLLGGTVVVMAGGGLDWLMDAATADAVSFALVGLILFVMCLMAAAVVFIPYGFIALGWLKLQQQQSELAKLPDDNTVGDPVEGERKYQQWISSVNSTEAFLGMVPRSDPYVPPEQRPPADAKPPRVKLSTFGKACTLAIVVAGAAVGVVLLRMARPEAEPLQMFTATLVGVLFATPPGLVIGLMVGRVEIEEEDDARGSDQQTA
jgi:hypothetical protein